MSEIKKGLAFKMQHHESVLTISLEFPFLHKKCMSEIEKGLACRGCMGDFLKMSKHSQD